MKWRPANLALPLFSKELGEMAQQRQTYVSRVAFTLLIFVLTGLFALPILPAARGAPLAVLGHGGRLLDVIYEVEWWGLCLFVPALVSPTLAAEKERQTLQLLFLTRLGPWTILLEKLLSRFVPVATFLLVSLPLLLMAYLLGGVTQTDVGFASLGLAATAFQVGCIALFCSAFFGTAAMALVATYAITSFVTLCPLLVVLALILLQTFLCAVLGHRPEFLNWIDNERIQPLIRWGMGATSGLDLMWYLNPNLALGVTHPFHRDYESLLLIACIGVAFLIAARMVVMRRAEPRSKHRFRRFLQLLDRGFGRVNDRIALGITLGSGSGALPGDKPVAWRENRRGNLGRIHYLVRIVMLLEVPILIPTVMYVITTRDLRFGALDTAPFLLWPIALLIVSVRSAGLIAAEKARQTLDVLLTTPLSLPAVAGQKLRGLWRVMVIVSVPILIQAGFTGYFNISAAGSHASLYRWQGFNPSLSAEIHLITVALYLIVILSLAAQLAFLFGLTCKTQGRAVTVTLGVFLTWSVIPIFIRTFGNSGTWVLYLSPISGMVANEMPQEWWLRAGSGMEMGRWGFSLLIHLGIYAAIVTWLAWFNYRLAGRILCRPVKHTLGPLLPRLAARRSSPSVTGIVRD